ncbi:MAG: CAP domain-containing protein [Candidatus Nanohaloarchaea archaeon]
MGRTPGTELSGRTLMLLSMALVFGLIFLGAGVYGLLGLVTSSGHRTPGINEHRIEMEIHEKINDRRTARGLEPLEYDVELAQIAGNYSREMAEKGFFSHTSPSGEDFLDRYREAGYRCRVRISERRYAKGGENLYSLHTDSFHNWTEERIASMAVKGWMNSEGHRENLLRPYWENEGIGVYIRGDHFFATQNFC